MPLLPSPKNPLVILKGFRDEFEQRTNMTNFDRDSKVRAIADVLTDEVLQQRQEIIEAFYANQLANARGIQLDEIGEQFGLPRRESDYAQMNVSEQNLAFYVESGDFGSINSGSPIVPPAGTIVSSDANANELNTTIQYKLTSSATLAATGTIAFASAQALNIGSGSNVGRETLRSHSFTGYTDAASNTLKIINFYPVLNGTDTESDDSYRYRLTQFYSSLIQVNNTRIQMNALTVPGVLQSKVLPGYYGIGTTGVAVMGAEFQTNDRMIRGVQQRLDATKTPAMTNQAIPAEQVTFDFLIEAKPARSLSNAQSTRLRAEIKKAILGYYRRKTVGDLIDLEELARAIQAETRSLVSLDSIGSARRFFKKAWIRKGFAGSVTDERQRLADRFYQLNQQQFGALGTLEINFV